MVEPELIVFVDSAVELIPSGSTDLVVDTDLSSSLLSVLPVLVVLVESVSDEMPDVEPEVGSVLVLVSV